MKIIPKLYIHADKNEITWNKKNYLLAAAERLGLEDKVLSWDEGVPNAEYILNIEPYGRIIQGGKWTGVWEIDCMFDRNEMDLSHWVVTDDVFVANPYIPDRMKGFSGNKTVLYQACDPVLHRRIPDIEPAYDFVICGSNGLDIYRERERLYQLLKEQGFTYYDYGKGFPPHEYVQKINNAKVQFIRSASKPPVGTTQIEQRFFECLAIGPVLKDYHFGLEHLGLVEGHDFFWYKDDDEMIEKMTYLIKNPEFAQKMAVNGRKKALLYHTYEHRLMTILQFAKEHERR